MFATWRVSLCLDHMEDERQLRDDDRQAEAESLVHWKAGPGTIGGISATVAVVGLVVTLLMMALMLDLYSYYRHGHQMSFGTKLCSQSPTMALIALLWLRRRSRRGLGFALRAAAWVPLLHLGLLLVGTSIWIHITSEDSFVAGHYALLDSTSFTTMAAAIAAALLVALWVYGIRTGGRRQPRILYPLAIFFLLYTFVLGMWLPLAPDAALPFHLPSWTDEALRFRDRFLWITLVAPLPIAMGLAALLSRVRAQKLFANYGLKLMGGSLLLIYLVVAIHARATADVQAIVAYANLLPLLLCSALLSLLALLAIALSHWQALRAVRLQERPAPWAQEGVVLPLPGSESLGRLYYLGWFLGLRVQCSRLTLRTDQGDLPIPAGARLICQVPLWTTRSRSGESSVVLKAGDRVRATGFVSPRSDNAFRRGGMPVPGSEGIVLSKIENKEIDVWQDLALIVWRPAILYLAIVSLIALPGLAGFFAI